MFLSTANIPGSTPLLKPEPGNVYSTILNERHNVNGENQRVGSLHRVVAGHYAELDTLPLSLLYTLASSPSIPL